MQAESYKSRIFTINDADARLRDPNDLTETLKDGNGNPLRIADGRKVKAAAIKMVPAGAERTLIFLNAADADSGEMLGWTSANNVAGQFRCETLGAVPPPNTNRFGPNALWSRGSFIGQSVLVLVYGNGNEIKRIAEKSCDAFLALAKDARAAGIDLKLNSGFRTFAEQQHLFDGHQRGLAGFNLAARPGRSNHQNGIAFDLEVGGGGSNPTYLWLKANATSHGFVRTVASEAWHWEFRPADAAKAKARGVEHIF